MDMIRTNQYITTREWAFQTRRLHRRCLVGSPSQFVPCALAQLNSIQLNSLRHSDGLGPPQAGSEYLPLKKKRVQNVLSHSPRASGSNSAEANLLRTRLYPATEIVEPYPGIDVVDFVRVEDGAQLEQTA